MPRGTITSISPADGATNEPINSAGRSQALQNDPDDALIVFNLACYWSLDGQRGLALSFLARALEIDSSYRDLIEAESDFDPIRNDPGFQALTTVIV